MIPLLIAAAVSSTVARHAIVVGSNHPLPGSGYDVLQYADDDAVRFHEYFLELGIDSVLLTTPDRETETRYPALAKEARRPTTAELDRALESLRKTLLEEGDANRTRELFFVFSGHGSITSSEAYLHLFDGKFTRTDLFERILKNMPVERVHVIIDSCHSYFLVNARGQRIAVAADEEGLDRYPWAGFLVSTSDRREVQEWSGYQAGVFSYQVLGALRGAADVDGDGVVDYSEVHAYIVAANYAVENVEARIQPYVRRPLSVGKSVLDLRAVAPGKFTRIPLELSGHFQVSERRRGPVLDAHKPSGSALAILLPESGEYWVDRGDDRYRVEASALVPLTEPILASSKGSIADELRLNLFRIPLSVDFVRGIEVASPQVTRVFVTENTAGPWHDDPLTLGMLGAGGAGLIGGLISTSLFFDQRALADRGPDEAANGRARERAELWRGAMIGSYAAGAALLAAGLLRAVLTNEDAEIPAAMRF